MATIGQNAATLSDWARRQDPDGKISTIVEIMNLENPIIEDVMFVEGNLPTGHKTTIRSGLPSVAWRTLNYGVQPSKSRTVQVTDTCGMLEAYAEVDKALADLNGNTAAFRLSEDRAFLESMAQEFATTLFYGDVSIEPEKFHGLSPRYNDTTAENGENIFLGGSVTDNENSSVWLISWGDQTCHGIFPKGQITGLQHKDLGEETLSDAAGGLYQGYRSHYKWDAGLCLRDWRYCSRLANVRGADLTSDASAGANLIENMIKMGHKIPSMGKGKMVYYVNEKVFTYLDLQTFNQSNMNVSYSQDPHGKPVMTFRGIPVKKVEALTETEALIS